MKLSNIQKKYKELISAHQRFEISTEELQTFMLEDGQAFSNFYQELEMDNVPAACHEDANYTKDIVQLHSHTFFEVLYCRSGNIQYLLGADRYQLHHGDIVFIPPGISHRPLYLDQLTEPYTRYVIWISPEFIQQIQTILSFSILSDPVLFRTQDSGWKYLEQYFRSAYRESETKQEGFQACLSSITCPVF